MLFVARICQSIIMKIPPARSIIIKEKHLLAGLSTCIYLIPAQSQPICKRFLIPWLARLQERWKLPRVDSNQRPMEGRPLANTRIRTAGLGQRKYCQRVDVYTHYIILSLTYRQLLYTRWLDEWSWLFVGLWLYLSGSMYICI